MRILLAAVLVLVHSVALAAPEVFSRVRIFIPDRATLGRVWASGVDHEGSTGKPGGWMEFIAGAEEKEELSRRGVAFDVLIEDLAAEYERQFTAGPVNALGFGYGSMGGFYTFLEVARQLDSMRLLYPGLITMKDTLATSVQGRPIWVVKISDNADTDEPLEAEALYTALHHAREPQGMMTVLYYMWWLLENYGSNPDATYLVNNRQLWFIPIVNPDGYTYNQTTNPSGGGMWRKNRRNNGTSYGVDLNRNYGPYYMWNAPNGGSSTSPSSDTYRGPSDFSEPETQGINFFMRGRAFRTALNYHTYGNYMIYPYGYAGTESFDSLTFRDWTYEMTRIGRYTNGTDLQTVNYSTRGNSDDFMYGDTTKVRTFAMTPEVGTTGFWPSSSLIFPLAVENLRSNMLVAYNAGQRTTLRSWSVTDAGMDGGITRGEAFELNLRMRNGGIGDASGLTVTAAANVGWMQFPAPAAIPALASRTNADIVIGGTVDSTAPAAGRASVIITCTDAEGYLQRDTVMVYVGTPVRLFTDSASSGTGSWSTGTGWGLTPNAHSAPSAFTDSPAGLYPADADNSLTLLSGVSLAGYQYAALRFWAKWSIEPSWDFATVEVSTNNGSSWTAGRTALSRPGSGRSGSKQPTSVLGYDSYTPGLDWTEQVMDLTPYAGATLRIRFRLATDGAEERDGLYVDDIRIDAYANIEPPAAPQLALPPDGAPDQPTSPLLVWRTEQGAAGYHLQVARDSTFSPPVVSDSLLADTLRQVSGLLPATPYVWRVRARNAGGWGSFSSPRSFVTTTLTTLTVFLDEGWNIVSLPLAVGDPRAATLFPGAASGAVAFNPQSGYIVQDSLAGGVGYWLKADSAAAVDISGHPVDAETVYVEPGWNLIGGLSVSIDTASIQQVPPGLVISAYLDYAGAYAPSATLNPGTGYWVKSSGSGMLFLRSPALRSGRRVSSFMK